MITALTYDVGNYIRSLGYKCFTDDNHVTVLSKPQLDIFFDTYEMDYKGDINIEFHYYTTGARKETATDLDYIKRDIKDILGGISSD